MTAAPSALDHGLRVTIGQINSSIDRGANLQVVLDVIEQAARVGSALVVLPEYAAAFHPDGVGLDLAEDLGGPFVTAVRAAAARHHVAVILGTVVPTGDGQHAKNVVVVVNADGVIVGEYTKVHLYDVFGARESDRFSAGDPAAPAVVVTVNGVAIGIMTCYDLRFPEQARRLVDAGADVIVVPAAWAAGPLKSMHWRTLAAARAIENTVVVIGVGQAGKGVIGESVIIGPDGVVGLEFGSEPMVRTADVDLAPLAEVRRSNPSLVNRRYSVVPRDSA